MRALGFISGSRRLKVAFGVAVFFTGLMGPLAIVGCAPSGQKAAPSTSIYSDMDEKEQDDGIVDADIDLLEAIDSGVSAGKDQTGLGDGVETQNSPTQNGLRRERGEAKPAHIGYQLMRASSGEVMSALESDRARTLASVTKIATGLAALRSVDGINVRNVSMMLRRSDNYSASLLLRRFAAAVAKIVLPPPAVPESVKRSQRAAHFCPTNGSVEEPGARAVLNWLENRIDIDWTQAKLADGNGCNENNRMSPSQLIQILRYADSLGTVFDGQDFASLLATPGGVGTLQSRLKNLDHHARVFAKTGTLHSAVTLAGYLFVPAPGGAEKYHFAILVDLGSGGEIRSGRQRIDALVRSWAKKLASDIRRT